MARKIKFQYQVKETKFGIGWHKDTWELRELIYPCDPNKSDKENLDDAFIKACELGADPNKNVRWKFFTEVDPQELADKFTSQLMEELYGNRFTSLDNLEDDAELNTIWECINERFYETINSTLFVLN